jgi:drug/metabolite transporter (DMT)-like permease
VKLFNNFAVCALAAAALNGLIGPLTKLTLQEGVGAPQIAFTKAFTAFLLLLGYCLKTGKTSELYKVGEQWLISAILAFMGIFCLYFFETQAFSEASVSLVSFLTYAAGGFTILLSAIFMKERITMLNSVSFLAIITGVFLMFNAGNEMSGSMKGATLALLGGLGYASFIFFAKYSNFGSGPCQLVWLFGFGSVYLLPPALADGFNAPSMLATLLLVALTVFPTIGGFYLTTRAIKLGEAGRVQIIETSDPLFATVFAFILLGEILSFSAAWGAGFIIIGLLCSLLASHNAQVVYPKGENIIP